VAAVAPKTAGSDWREMASNLFTAAEAASMLKVRESWLKRKASARLIPCTFVGKHLRFSDDDIAEIMKAGAREPIAIRAPKPRREGT
jgi:excisionase family DNA binding protein